MDELREQFDAAWDEHASDEEKQAAEPAAHVEAEPAAEPVAEPAAEPVAEPVGEVDQTVDVSADPVETPQAEEPAPTPDSKAPATWSPANREHWDKLPADVQAQVAKREREVDEVLRTNAESRKSMAAFDQVVGPYRDHMQRQGQPDPMQAISSLLQVEHGLAMGSPAQKAQQVATIMQQYGVDVGTLADVLQGTPGATEQDQIGQLIDQRLAPLNTMVQQFQQNQNYQNQQQNQGAMSEVQTFESTHEFVNEVRLDMAEHMERAAKSGQNMDLQQAYDRACQFHPEVSKILIQRAEQQQLMGNSAQLAAKKSVAGNQLTGTQGGSGAGAGPLDLRNQLMDAWDSQRGG